MHPAPAPTHQPAGFERRTLAVTRGLDATMTTMTSAQSDTGWEA